MLILQRFSHGYRQDLPLQAAHVRRRQFVGVNHESVGFVLSDRRDLASSERWFAAPNGVTGIGLAVHEPLVKPRSSMRAVYARGK
jgi:hypothetical protein